MNEEKSTSGGYDRLLLILLILAALLILYRFLLPWIIETQKFIGSHPITTYSFCIFCFLNALTFGIAKLWNHFAEIAELKAATKEDDESVYLGIDVETRRRVHLKAAFRTMHTQLIGTTNSGKTASIMQPLATQDIELGRGLIFIDGKSDQSLLDKLYAATVQAGRKKDFIVFSLSNPNISSTFNPFCIGTPEQITERVFSSFAFTDEYYKNIQFSALRTVTALLMHRGQVPMPGVVRELLRDKEKLKGWCEGLKDENLLRDVLALTEGTQEDFLKNYSGLVTHLGHFSQGETAALFNTKSPEIILADILKNRKICYFQLPTLQFPFLGEATGKLLLQSLQSAISELQGSGSGRLNTLFSVYLDDFNDYIYPGFASLLNKSRSANIGVVFAHQSLGDLEKVSPDFKQIVLTNTNIKIIMRSNDPDSAEHFAKTIGTVSKEKTTERRKKGVFKSENTGDQSVRVTEEYIFHPNVFKSELGLGEGVVVIPHAKGRLAMRIKFQTVPELPRIHLPIRELPVPNFGQEAMTLKPQNTALQLAAIHLKKKQKLKKVKYEQT